MNILTTRNPVIIPEAPQSKRIFLTKNTLIWKSPEDIKKFFGDKGVTVLDKVVNLNGMVFSGAKLPRSQNRQDENALGIKVMFLGLVLKNGWVEDIPGGISVREKYSNFTNLTFTKIGEDAISTVGERALGISIQRCSFYNFGGDKAIQLNQADYAKIEDCKIFGGITGIRLQKDSYKTEKPVAWLINTEFIECETGMNAAGKIVVKTQNLKFSKVRKHVVLSNQAKIEKI